MEKARMLCRMMCINQVLKRFKMPRMKIDTIQFIMNRLRLSQKFWWYDLGIYVRFKTKSIHNLCETIHAKSETKWDMIQIKMNRFRQRKTHFLTNGVQFSRDTSKQTQWIALCKDACNAWVLWHILRLPIERSTW